MLLPFRRIDSVADEPALRPGVQALGVSYDMTHDPALEAPGMRRLFVTQLCDLVAVTIGATRDAAAASHFFLLAVFFFGSSAASP